MGLTKGKKKGAPWAPSWFTHAVDFDDAGCPRLYLDDDVVLVLHDARLAGGDVRGRVDAARGDQIIHRHYLHTMASVRSRKEVVRELGKKGVTLSDEALVDLDTKARERFAEEERLAEERKAARSAGSTGTDDPHAIQVGNYAGTTNPADPGLYALRDLGQKRLTNFCTRIVAQELEDDGVHEPQRHFVLESIVRGGGLVTCTIPASEFKGQSWVHTRLGARALVYPGQATKDETSAAIQIISDAPPVHHIFTHTGWRLINGVWHYLHGDGAIRPSGAIVDVIVRLEDDLSRFRLPPPPVGAAAVAAVQASLELFTLAPSCVMAPVLGATYVAPLIEALGDVPPDFVLWLLGGSQQFKSTVAAFAQAHFGLFTRVTLPANFSGTHTALEIMGFRVKDALLVVDDFKPATSPLEAQDMERNAARLLRSAGNRRARARANAHMKIRESYPPRGFVMATAERLPAGHSTLGRLFEVPVQKGNVSLDRVLAAQQAQERYPAAMARYVQWIAAHMDVLRKRLPRRYEELRTQAMTAGDPPREPGQVAHLQLGIEVFSEFAIEIGALDVRAAENLRAQSWEAMRALGAEHVEHLAAQRPAARFLALLSAGFSTRRIYVEAKTGGPPEHAERYGWAWMQVGAEHEWRHEPHGQLVGWLDGDEHLLLIPDETYKYVVATAAIARESFSTDKATLLKLLEEEKLIATQKEKRESKEIVRREVMARCGGKNQRVVKLRCAALEPQEPDVSTAAAAGNGTGQKEAPPNQTPTPPVSMFPPLPPKAHEGGPRGGVWRAAEGREPGREG